MKAQVRRAIERPPMVQAQRAAAFKAGEDAIEAFGHYQQRRNFSERTIHARRCVLVKFNWHGAALSLLTATKAEVERWLDSMPLGPQGRYTYTSHLHAFYRFSVREGLTTEDPTLTIDRPRLPKRLPRPLPPGDLARALEAADARQRAFLCLGAYQGFRISDMAGLCREDVLDDREPAMLRVIQGKGKKDRCLPLHPKTLEALQAYGLPDAGPIFQGAAGGPMQVGHVGFIITRLFRYLGITATPHALRHAFGTNVYARSKDVFRTQRLMGHASVQTTMGYVELVGDEEDVDIVRGLGGED